MLGAAFLALNACGSTQDPSPAIGSTPAADRGSAVPTVGSTSPPVSSASPAVAASPRPLGQSDADKPLTAGTYRLGDPFGAPFAITVPATWRLKTLAPADVQFSITQDGESYPAWIVVDLVENVFADPCKPGGGPKDPPVAANVDAIVEALTHMAGYTAGPVTNVTLGAHQGKAVEIMNSAACSTDDMLPMWTNKGGGGGASPANLHATEQLWVLDVNGTPVIVDGETFDGTPAALRDAIKPIIETIAFDQGQ